METADFLSVVVLTFGAGGGILSLTTTEKLTVVERRDFMRKDYLSSLSRAARWYLPPAEAAEVLEDYREIVEGRTEEALRRDLGTPRAVMRQLAQTGAYRQWVAVFAVLAGCILLPAALPLLSELSVRVIFGFDVYGADLLWWFPNLCGKIVPFRGALFLTGMALALVWFRRRSGEERRRSLPKGVAPLLAVLLMGMVFEWVTIWSTLVRNWEGLTYEIASVLRLAMTLDMFAMGAIGTFALVKARLADRRWRAVYILALAGSILGMSVFALWRNMDVSFSAAGWQRQYVTRYLWITLLGLVGTGAALC